MPLEFLDKQIIFEGKKIRLEVHRMKDADDRKVFKEIVVHPGAVVILPLLDADTVLLIRNRRQTIGQFLVELPAGTLEKSEHPMNCAGRELLEETGYLARKMQPLLSFFTSPGIMTEKIHAFVATELTQKTQALEVDEEIEILPTPLVDAIEMIRTGEIQDGKTVATLLFYERFARLR